MAGGLAGWMDGGIPSLNMGYVEFSGSCRCGVKGREYPNCDVLIGGVSTDLSLSPPVSFSLFFLSLAPHWHPFCTRPSACLSFVHPQFPNQFSWPKRFPLFLLDGWFGQQPNRRFFVRSLFLGCFLDRSRFCNCDFRCGDRNSTEKILIRWKRATQRERQREREMGIHSSLTFLSC